MKGMITDSITDEKREVDDLSYELEYTKDGKVFILHNGITGWESFYIKDDIIERLSKGGWHANVGVKGAWSDLMISAEEMKNAFENLGLL